MVFQGTLSPTSHVSLQYLHFLGLTSIDLTPARFLLENETIKSDYWYYHRSRCPLQPGSNGPGTPKMPGSFTVCCSFFKKDFIIITTILM